MEREQRVRLLIGRLAEEQIGIASELDVKWFESFRRLQDDRRGVVAIAAHHGNMAAKEEGSGAQQPVESG